MYIPRMEHYQLLRFLSVVRTLARTFVICSYLPVELGKFSKLIMSLTPTMKFSCFGNIEYGDVLFKMGVPNALHFASFGVHVGVDVPISFRISSSVDPV